MRTRFGGGHHSRRALGDGRHLLTVWLPAENEHSTLIVSDEDVLVDIVNRVCNRKKLRRSEYVAQYKPDPAKDKLADLDTTLQFRQTWTHRPLTEVYLAKGALPRRGRRGARQLPDRDVWAWVSAAAARATQSPRASLSSDPWWPRCVRSPTRPSRPPRNGGSAAPRGQARAC